MVTYASLAHTEASAERVAGSTVGLEEVGELDGSLDRSSLTTRDEDLHLGEIQGERVGDVLRIADDLSDEEVGAEGVRDAEAAAPLEEVAGLLDDGSGRAVVLTVEAK